MRNHAAQPIRPATTVRMITAYVAKWPLRHVYGGEWLSNWSDRMLIQIGSQSVMEIYGLEVRDSRTPPKIHDLFLVSVMQGLILLGLVALAWWMWITTNDYVIPAFIVFSVFHLIPSQSDFLKSGSLADKTPKWLKPFTGALSFVVSLPAMIVALPAAVLWGLIGWAKLEITKSEER